MEVGHWHWLNARKEKEKAICLNWDTADDLGICLHQVYKVILIDIYGILLQNTGAVHVALDIAALEALARLV